MKTKRELGLKKLKTLFIYSICILHKKVHKALNISKENDKEQKNEEEKIKQTYRKLNFGYSKCERKEVYFWTDMLFPFLHS